jgi:hypothetical protein
MKRISYRRWLFITMVGMALIFAKLPILNQSVVFMFKQAWIVKEHAGEPAAPLGPNYIMVNSIVASGRVSTPMASTNYQMRGVLGEPGLPDNETNLTSQNFQHQPGFLAAEPSTLTPTPTPGTATPTPTPGTITPTPTPSPTPSPTPTSTSVEATRVAYLPAIINVPVACFEGPFEEEPNNSAAQANGRLCSQVTYQGQGSPTDQNDYYHFYLAAAGLITIDFDNDTNLNAQQVQLFYQSTDGPPVAIGSGSALPYHIEYLGQPGWYYIRVYTAPHLNLTVDYTLVVTYPD